MTIKNLVLIPALLTLGSVDARADTIYLSCSMTSASEGGLVATQPWALVVDEDHGAADGHPATITPLAVDWQTTQPSQDPGVTGQDTKSYHLDRTTGVLAQNEAVFISSPSQWSHSWSRQWTCAKVPEPETKF